MRGKIQGIILFLLLLLGIQGTIVMASQQNSVYDDAQLLTEGERNALNEEIAVLREKSDWNIYAVSTVNAEGKSATAYADDFFDMHSPEQEDGVVLLIDMDNREITISTCGEAVSYLTDKRIDSILDDAYYDVSNEAYEACFLTMIDGVTDAYKAGVPSGQYEYDTETGKVSRHHSVSWLELLIAVVLAVGSGAAVYIIVVGRYRMHFGNYQYDFHENGTVELQKKEDHFINEITTHRRIPKPTNSGSGHSGGRSSTHTSSSGRSHGGGSRKF